MIESHVYVIITCDECAKTFESEEYDYEHTQTAESHGIAIAKAQGWDIGVAKDFCPICKGASNDPN